MSAKDELNKLLKNSKFISQKSKDEYEEKLRKLKEPPIVDANVENLKNIFGMK